jgi:ABC-type branched-subunit amino acid transport system ATPase component
MTSSSSALVKTFGRTRALDGLDLRVSEGEVHGFLGPNGAGKSNAGGGELNIHGRDGQIRAKDTIAPGNDPRNIRG